MNPKTPAKGRPKGKPGAKTAARVARRQKLAAAVVTGKSIADIAKEEGVSRSWASREANAPATRVLIDRILDKHAEEVEDLVKEGLKAIRDCIGPFATIKFPGVKNPSQVPNEPRVRLLATKRIIELSAAGRKHEEGTGDVMLTWQNFLTIYQEKRQAA